MRAPPIDADAPPDAHPLPDEVTDLAEGGASVRWYAVELAREIRIQSEERRAAIEVVPPLLGGRPLAWILGLAATLAIGGLTAMMVIHADSPPVAATAVDLPPVSADEPCAARMHEIMQAIARFRRDHGKPPETLSALGPPYLTAPPIDPVSGKPYHYTKRGIRVTVACPSPSEPLLAESPQP